MHIRFYLFSLFFIFSVFSRYGTNEYVVKNLSNSGFGFLSADSLLFEKTDTLNLFFVGDIMCHSQQFTEAYVDSLRSYDFNPSFKLLKDRFSGADLVFGNLETVLAGKKIKYAGYPRFNSPDELLAAINNSGFNILNLANNHILDYGVEGLIRTANLIDSLKIIRTGVFLSEKEKDSIKIIEVNKFRLAFLSYTEHTNGYSLKKGSEYFLNYINYENMKNDIAKVKSLSPDLIFVYFHYGEEYVRIPGKYQVSVVDSVLQYGADVVIASHPHVIQPFVIRKSISEGKLDSNFIAYSLGNFISSQTGWQKQSGVILNLRFIKSNNKISISDINITPTYTYTAKHKNGSRKTVVPLDNMYSGNTELMFTARDSVYIEKIKSDPVFVPARR